MKNKIQRYADQRTPGALLYVHEIWIWLKFQETRLKRFLVSRWRQTTEKICQNHELQVWFLPMTKCAKDQQKFYNCLQGPREVFKLTGASIATLTMTMLYHTISTNFLIQILTYPLQNYHVDATNSVKSCLIFKSSFFGRIL